MRFYFRKVDVQADTNYVFANAFISANTGLTGGGSVITRFMKEDIGLKIYEYTNHGSALLTTSLGNVLLTTNDKRLRIDNNSDNLIDSYLADDLSKSDYYPYGMPMMGRNTNLSDYRFGYQGSEMDNEFDGSAGSHYTTYFRQLDPRLGRWMSIDPVTQPWQSPYTSMDCNPIKWNDVNGDAVGIIKPKSGGVVLTGRQGQKIVGIGGGGAKLSGGLGRIFNGAGKFGNAMKALVVGAIAQVGEINSKSPIDNDTKFVDEKGKTIVETDDKSNDTYVIPEKKEKQFLDELERNAKNSEDLSIKANRELGEKYGFKFNRENIIDFKMRTTSGGLYKNQDGFLQGYSCGYAPWYKKFTMTQCYGAAGEYSEGGTYSSSLSLGMRVGGRDFERGFINILDPQLKAGPAQFIIVPQNLVMTKPARILISNPNNK